MDMKHQQEGATEALNAAIEAINLAKISSVTPAKAAFGSVSAILVVIKDSMIDQVDYVDLGLACADTCRALDRGLKEIRADGLNQPVLEAVKWLTTTLTEIESKIVKRGKRSVITQVLHTKRLDREMIATWRSNLKRILQVFEAELLVDARIAVSDTVHGVPNTSIAVSDAYCGVSEPRTVVPDVRSNDNPVVSNVFNASFTTRTIISETHRNELRNRENTNSNNRRAPYASAPGELPPPLPKNTSGMVSDIRDSVEKNRAIVSKVHRDVVDTQTMVSDLCRNVLKREEGTGSQHWSTRTSMPGESPPPPPRVFFGRDELIEEIVGFAKQFLPVALIGAGGIGKTSIALTVLHNDRVKQQFGDNRRFIRCDQFPPSLTNFIGRLSKVIGAGIENPEDLAPLRPFLSSNQMIIVLDNAESILDPLGPDAQDILPVIEELSQLRSICLCITSRITTVPPDCETIRVPMLTMEAARDTFYRFCNDGGRTALIDSILKQLDFHPLSVTLLATVANQNNWDTNRLTKEWERRRTGVLHTPHNRSLAATIEFSLSSPMFRGLSPEARDLLGVVAFFPQGVDEKNIDWLFPAVPDRSNIFDTFCILSLTYRGDGFITMLAPLRDYLRPDDPELSPLLCAAKDRYFHRLSVDVYPDKPGHEEARWITSEDVNVEYLLDVFASINPDSDDVWDASINLMKHLLWHKRRSVVLGSRIEGLPDDHPSKLQCMYELAQLLNLAGNHMESKRLLTRTLQLWRERGDDFQIAQTLRLLANVHRLLGSDEEGKKLVKESLKLFERLGKTVDQAHSLQILAWLLYTNDQLAEAETAAYRVLDLLPDDTEQFLVCRCHRFLGYIHLSKDEVKEATNQFKLALAIATSFNWHTQLFWNHYSLGEVAFTEDNFDDANRHIGLAKLHAVNYTYLLGRAMHLQATIWYQQRRIEEARSEALAAADVLERLGASSQPLEDCRALLKQIELAATVPEPDKSGELPDGNPVIGLPTCYPCGFRIAQPVTRQSTSGI